MQKNPKLLMLLSVIAIVIIFGFFWSKGSNTVNNKNQPDNAKQHQAFDVASGDTNNEVLKSIVAKQRALQAENQHLLSENKKLQSEQTAKTTAELTQAEESLTQKINLSKEKLESQFKSELSSFKSTDNTSAGSGKLEYPMSGKGHGLAQSNMITTIPDLSSSAGGSEDDLVKPKQNNTLNNNSPELPSDRMSSAKQKSIIPYYTIPALSTAPNAVLLSPLVGEVPVNGELESPAFPFKAILSPKNAKDMFSANGVPLPEGISGAILQGYSIGNMSQGCTRAYVMKILFVFNDGHYVVYPKSSDSESDSATKIFPTKSLGYLSDAYNNSCIAGRYITDAPRVIASLAALGAGAGVGGAIAQAQTQTVSNISQGTTGSIISGSLGKYAEGVAIGNASKAALDWYKARINNIFDVVFVPSTLNGKPRSLIFNVTKTIPIDLNQKGRKLRYENSSEMSATDHSFE